MRFSLAVAASALLAIVSSQATQHNNAFSVPVSGTYLLHAGQPTTFTWTALAGSTVTLKLRDGDRSDLSEGVVLTSNLPNKGSYTYNVPSNIVEGANYAIEIINNDDPTDVNYTPQFVIESPNKTVPTASSGSASASASATGATVTSLATVTSGTSVTVATLTATSISNSTVIGNNTSSPSKITARPSSTASPTVPAGNSAGGLKVGGAMLALVCGAALVL